MKQSGRKWGVLIMLMGEFHHNLDEKGRLVIPSKFRNELGKEYVITKGLDKCLFVYSLNEFDKQGRINITSPLVHYANITKECVIIGALERLEIWSLEDYNKYMKENEDDLANIAEDIFDMNYEA